MAIQTFTHEGYTLMRDEDGPWLFLEECPVRGMGWVQFLTDEGRAACAAGSGVGLEAQKAILRQMIDYVLEGCRVIENAPGHPFPGAPPAGG